MRLSALSTVFNAMEKMAVKPSVRFIKNGNLSGFTALSGTTTRGVKWTKLYNTEGELVSWKSALNGKIKKGKYEKVDSFDWNKGATTEIAGNKKTTTVKFDGFEAEKYPRTRYNDSAYDPFGRSNPLSPNYDPYGYNSPLSSGYDPFKSVNDPFSTDTFGSFGGF